MVCARCGTENVGGAKFCSECAAPLEAWSSGGEKRKTVTVLFCDLTGSTALGETVDPERLRVVLAGYFERMRAIVERHGGSVEKFIGDAVMAVFGVPVLHEDDALRAVRAAVEMRDALPELGLQGRIGVMTGEVVTGTEERLATGDAVNVAARLEQAATPGEVLIGEPTLRLVREACEVERVEPLALKGKAEPVVAFRLLRVLPTRDRRHESLFVGRGREQIILREAWVRAQAERRCELVTIVGDAGVGKSRLVAELVASLEATVVRGRCLSYGEGITYWPVVEVLKQLGLLPEQEAAAAAIRSLLGETQAATSPDELAWAFRKTLEQAAAERPLVVVFDDVHWAEETFLDLVEHVALLSSGAPILLVCIARPEVSERRPGWPVTLRLEPLGDEDVAGLIPERVADELRERITRAAGGNPLFVGEMLAMAAEAGGEVLVPPTMRALLAARLDQLEAPERGVLERAAIEGEIFHRGAVQALAPEESQVTPRLAALVRKELIRPDRPQLPGEDGFRFRHLLLRDAAYDALPKSLRAELHERFAAWLEEHGTALVELDEILGYHLEQACRYRVELGLPAGDRSAAAARRRLTAAGFRAQQRGDHAAAVRLLERAVALTSPPEIDVGLEVGLIDALSLGGRGREALGRADSLAERAAAAGNRMAELCARIESGRLRTYLEPEGATEKLSAIVEEALPLLEAAGNDLALYIAYYALGQVANMRAQMDAALAAYERAAHHARQAGLPHEFLGWRATFRLLGATPVSEFLAWLDEQESRGPQNVSLRLRRAGALARLGRFAEARKLVSETRVELADRGASFTLAGALSQDFLEIELLAGDPVAAAELGEEGCRMLDELGEQSLLSTSAAKLGQALYALDRLDEAELRARRSEQLGASDDVLTQMLWRQVRAKVLARRGEHLEAERLAREAVAISEETDMLDAQGEAHEDLAAVLELVGKPDEAATALEQAIVRYERKGNVVAAERAHRRLARFD